MTDKISEKDKKDWEDFLFKNEKLPNKDVKIDKKRIFKTRSIDLHGYSLEEANKFIEKFIIKSYQEKINRLIVVTERSVSLTKLSKFLSIYSLLIMIFSPERSVAVKLISSKIFSIIV